MSKLNCALLRGLGGRLLLVAMALFGGAVLAQDAITYKGTLVHPSRVLVKFKNPGAEAKSMAKEDLQSLKVVQRYENLPGLVVLDEANAARAVAIDAKAKVHSLSSRIESLKQAGLFEYVEPDYIRQVSATPSDAAFADGRLWGLRNTGQSGGLSGADIKATSAWDFTTGSRDVVVAVIDTGIRYTHRDLETQMWRNPGEIAGNSIDDDGDGYVDNVFGINAVSNTGDPFDDNGHGTHVAGTIGAAANDDNPHVGVAWEVRLMGLKFLNGQGSGKTSDEIKCIDFAIAKGVDIINASYGGSGFSQAQYDAISRARDAGILFVCAAGNESLDNEVSPSYPNSHDLENIVSVAALDRSDNLASFSNFGATRVDLGAPGVSIFSCWIGSDSDYKTISGTSMASPHVAGVAALVKARFPGLPLADWKARLLDTTVSVPALSGKCVTGGRVNAFEALNAVPDGVLEISLTPAGGINLLAGSMQTFRMRVTDALAVTGANITATLGSANLNFLDNGVAPDEVSSDGVYSVSVIAPAFSDTATFNASISAAGKDTANLQASYSIITPVVNNDFGKRSILTGTTATATGGNLRADKQTGEPNHGGNPGGHSVWWTWTAPADGAFAVDTQGSDFDTLLGVYTGSVVGSLTLVGGNDDVAGGTTTSRVAFMATSGTAYQIAVDGYGSSSGQIVLNLAEDAGGLAPENDNFANPEVVASGDAILFGNNENATKETGEFNHAGNAGGASVWYSWTAPNTGTTTITTAGSNFDTLLAIYTGTVIDALTVVADNDDSAFGGTHSQLSFASTGGTTYLFAVDGYAGSTGDLVLQLNHSQAGPPPANDEFANRITLTGSTVSTIGSNVGATIVNEEPVHAGNIGGKSVWWTWTAPANGLVTIDTAGSDFDTLLAVYTGNVLSSLALVAGNDDATSGERSSSVFFNASSGTTYQIAVDGYSGETRIAAEGSITLNIDRFSGQVPANDNFANATVVSGAGFSVGGSNVGTTVEEDEPIHAGNLGGKSVWWRWTAPASGVVNLSTSGSNFDTLLAAYAGASLDALSTIADNDDDPAGGTRTSALVFNATAGETYHIAVDGYNGVSGNIVLTLTQVGSFTNVLDIGFETNEGYFSNAQLAGQDGWEFFGSGGNAVISEYFTGQGQHGFIGGTQAPSFNNRSLYLWKEFSASPTAGQLLQFSVNFSILDSNNGKYDFFGWEFYNSNGQALFSVYFDNNPGNAILYSLDDGSGNNTGFTYANGVLYGLRIEMDPSNNRWSAFIEGIKVVDNQPMTTQGRSLNIAEVNAFWFLTTLNSAGNNGMVFDNYRVDVIDPMFAPTITSHPEGVAVTEGDTTSLTVAAEGTGTLQYQWFHNDEPVPSSNVATLGLSNIKMDQAGRYRVRVSNSFGTAMSNEALVEVIPFVAPPMNDDFASRTTLAGLSATITGSTVSATRQTGEPSHAGNLGGASVWWTWTAPETRRMVLSSLGSDFDTLLAVYTGNSVNALTPIAANDDAQSRSRGSLVEFDAQAGTVYQIAVDGYSGDSGTVRLAVGTIIEPVFGGTPQVGGQGFQLNFSSEPGVSFVIQSSTNLVDWVNVTTKVSDETGGFSYTDPGAMGSGRKFYRAFREP